MSLLRYPEPHCVRNAACEGTASQPTPGSGRARGYAAAHAALGDPGGVAFLLDSLREAGVHDQAAAGQLPETPDRPVPVAAPRPEHQGRHHPVNATRLLPPTCPRAQLDAGAARRRRQNQRVTRTTITASSRNRKYVWYRCTSR